MIRRQFIQSSSAAALGLTLGQRYPLCSPNPTNQNLFVERGSFSLDGHLLRIYHPQIHRSFRMIMMADTHLFLDDMRGEPYQSFSGRMAKAYNQTKHFLTGAVTNPEESMLKTLQLAQEKKAELVALIGDILSFPAEAGVDWAMQQLRASGLSFVYTAGNHDWHYEGLGGTIQDLRRHWCSERLKPFYQGHNPLMDSRVLHGVRLVTIDNSTYQILPEQLEFLKTELAFSQPTVLMVHIPLYAPGRPVGFGCGHPAWGSSTDKNYELERRERWPAGHTTTTFAFHQEVFSAPNLIAVLTGHIHRPSIDVLNGIPQVVVDANATGAYLDVEFITG